MAIMPLDQTGKEVKVGDIICYAASIGNDNWGYRIAWSKLQVIKITFSGDNLNYCRINVVDIDSQIENFISDDKNFVIVGHRALHDYQFADNI